MKTFKKINWKLEFSKLKFSLKKKKNDRVQKYM